MIDAQFPPPKQVGPQKFLDLTGMLIPWAGGQPVLLNMMGVDSSVQYLPLFSEPEPLEAVLAQAGVGFESIKQVDDGPEFLDSIPVEIIVITDLRYTPEGKIRFHQVQR
jgi:hypothetical protein